MAAALQHRRAPPWRRRDVEPLRRAPLGVLRQPRHRLPALEGADAAEGVLDFVALAGVVVPVELAGLLAFGELVRAIAIRLVLGEAALAQPDFLAFHHVLGGFLLGALGETGHTDSFPRRLVLVSV